MELTCQKAGCFLGRRALNGCNDLFRFGLNYLVKAARSLVSEVKQRGCSLVLFSGSIDVQMHPSPSQRVGEVLPASLRTLTGSPKSFG